MRSLRDASYILGTRFAADLLNQIWLDDPVRIGNALSLRRVAERFSDAGAALRRFHEEPTAVAWENVTRPDVAAGLRQRVADPAVMRQVDTQFCGPISIAFELARRDPKRYVETVAAIFADGRFTTPNGRVIEAEEELREGTLPAVTETNDPVHPTDWLITSTLRDDANWFFDIDGDDAKDSTSAYTTWEEMEEWTRDVLGLRPEREMSFSSSEIEAIRLADKAVAAGGVAFLNINANLIKTPKPGEPAETEEDVGYQRLDHFGKAEGFLQSKKHSKDDGIFDHWVVYLGGLKLAPGATQHSTSPIELRVWSWGAEFLISGTTEAFCEYLYAAIVGFP